MSHYNNYHHDEDRGRKRRRRTRWAPADTNFYNSALSAIPKYIPDGLTIEQQEALAVRVRIEEITKKLNLNDLDIDYSNDRSPSPEPVYDKEGKRVNTRDQRAKEKLTYERHELVLLATLMHPQFKPPADYQPVSIKKFRKIPIPIERFPEYNFIGLIIGPRGNTQKRMERETGCKIAIRGKGSVKEGKGRRDGKGTPGETEPLHVLVTGDTEAQIEKAARMVTDLLVPMEEGKNEHKRQQLRELAEINGTLRDRMWMSPDEPSFDRTDVKCAICGETSHPTSDCSLRGKGARIPVAPEQKAQIDNEYEKFLSEIGEAPAPPPVAPNQADAYAEFMAAIGETSAAQPAPPAPVGEAPPPWAAQPALNPAVPPQVYPGGVPPPWAAAPAAYGMPGAVPGAMPWGAPMNAWGAPAAYPGYPPVPWQQPPQ